MKLDLFKSFGYPVLRPLAKIEDSDEGYAIEPQNQDYVNTDFQGGIGSNPDNEEPNIFVFSWDLDFPVPEIERLVELGKIAVVGKIYCRDSMLSIGFPIEVTDQFREEKLLSGEYRLESQRLSGEYSFTIFLIANQEVTIKSSLIHPDFGFDEFTLSSGQVVGFSLPNVDDARPNKLQKMDSIFVRVQDESLSKSEYKVDFTGDYIKILASPEFLYKLKILEESKEGQVKLINSLYAPITVTLLREMSHENPNRDDLEHLIWFRTINDKFQQLPEAIRGCHSPELITQHFFKMPLLDVVN